MGENECFPPVVTSDYKITVGSTTYDGFDTNWVSEYYGSEFRLYKFENNQLVNPESGFDVEVIQQTLNHGTPYAPGTYGICLTFDGNPRYTGTYYILTLSSRDGNYYGIKLIVSDDWSDVPHVTAYYNYTNPTTSIIIPTDCFYYGLKLNYKWSNFKEGYKDGQIIYGRVINNIYYKLNSITASGGMTATLTYSDYPVLVRPVTFGTSDINFNTNFSSNAETFTLRYPTYTAENTAVETTLTYTSGQTFTLPQPGTRGEHYTFQYWSVVGAQLQPGQSVTVLNLDLDISSVWKGATYTVSYNIEEGASPSQISPSNVNYPNAVKLPTITKPNYYFSGWSDGTTTYLPGSNYYPNSDVTLSSVFQPNQYTVRFYDVGQSTPFSVQTVTYPARVNVPTTQTVTGISFSGWMNEQTSNIEIVSGTSTYQPLSDVDFRRVYTYNLTLYSVNTSGVETQYTTYSRIPYPTQYNLPQPWGSYDSVHTPPGYEMKGWADTANTPNPNNAYEGTYTFTPSYTVVDNVVVLQAIPKLYTQFTPKLLTDIDVATSLSITKEQTVTVEPSTDPEDWVGTLQWNVTAIGGEASTYLSIAPSSDGRSVAVSGLNANESGITLTLTVSGKIRTWESQSAQITKNISVTVYAYNTVRFFTRDAYGREQPYNDNISGTPPEPSNVFYVSTDTRDWELVGSKRYPDDPTRAGYLFLGWADGDGNLVDSEHPPLYPTDCYATWTYQYEDQERDSAYLQLFNFDGTRMLKQIDLGVIQTNTETFTTGVSATPTPTMTSTNTFITNLACTESIRVEIIRVSPHTYNDDSDNPHDWSNRKWITEMRALVDRWQASTDGIKFLYIPRNMTVTEIVGQLAGFGDNYDLLGYAESYDSEHPQDNLGLLFAQGNDTYVLRGYNGIIDAFTDTYNAQNQTVISVSFTVTLGGMKSKYQSWKDAMVLMQ